MSTHAHLMEIKSLALPPWVPMNFTLYMGEKSTVTQRGVGSRETRVISLATLSTMQIIN